MPFRIQEIKSKLEFGGARPTLFNVDLQLPGDIEYAGKDGVNKKLTFLCKAASIPASNIAPIEVPYFGRKIKIAGNRTFDEWTITIINDEDFVLRAAFEFWMNAINHHVTNLRNSGATSNPNSYKTDAKVRQYSKGPNESPIRKYKFEGVFPTAVSAIDLAWDADNTIEEFTVTLQYDIWTLDESAE